MPGSGSIKRASRESPRCYALAGDERERQSAAFTPLAEMHERMLCAYRGGRYALGAKLAAQAPGLAPPRFRDLYDLYERRCRRLDRARPAGWSPVADFSLAPAPVDI